MNIDLNKNKNQINNCSSVGNKLLLMINSPFPLPSFPIIISCITSPPWYNEFRFLFFEERSKDDLFCDFDCEELLEEEEGLFNFWKVETISFVPNIDDLFCFREFLLFFLFNLRFAKFAAEGILSIKFNRENEKM